MGILDKFKNEQSNKKTTRGFYLGSPEAEGENKKGLQNFQNFFDDYLSILPQLENERFIFTGRKGSGKSAIAKYIKDTAEKTDGSFCDLIRLNDIEIEKLVQLDELNQFENKESVIFEWLILVRIIKLLIKNDSFKYVPEYDKLKKFIERNSGIVNIDKFQIKEVIEKKKLEVAFEVLKHINTNIGRAFDSKTVKAPFYKLINPLKEIVLKVIQYDVNKEKEFWLLFDDLDINFKANDKDSINRITELIRISKIYNTEFFKDTNTKILIFLRDDIKKIIELHNGYSAKIFSSYEININWYDHQSFKSNENQTQLKKFINKRIELNFQANKISFDNSNAWNRLIEEDTYSYNGKSSFKYIIDFTFYRPRDLILFFNPIGKEDYLFPMKGSTVKALLKKYFIENVSELRNEISIYFEPIAIQQLLDSLKSLTHSGSSYNYDLLSRKLSGCCNSKSVDEIINILWQYSIIIPKDSDGKLYFNYRENSHLDTINLKEWNFTLHKNIYHYFYPENI